MKILILIILVFSQIIIHTFAQVNGMGENNSIPSSLKNLQKLMKENPDTYRIKFLELEKELTQQKEDKNLINLYQLHVRYLENVDAYDSIINILHQVRWLQRSQPEKESLNTYIMLGSIYYFKRNYDSLIFYQNKAEKLIKADSPEYGSYLLMRGLRSYMEDSYLDAITYLLKAVEIFEVNKDNKRLAVTFNNLANNYEKLENFQANIEYLQKAININKKQGFTYDLIYNYNNLGVSFRKQNLLKEALDIYNLAYEELKKVNFPMLLAQNLTNRANITEKLGDMKTAESLFLESEQISTANNITYGVLLANINLGNLYRQMKKFEQAKERLERALKLSSELSALKEKALVLERFARLAKDQQDFEKAYSYLSQYYSLNDSLISESVKKQANELKEKYEAEKKELKIISLSNDKLQQEYLIALLGLGILFLLLVFNWRKNKHQIAIERRIQEEQRLKFELELKEKELLSDSLKQVSVMSTKESIYNDLKELIKDLPKTQIAKFSPVLNELRGEQDQTILLEFEKRFLGVYESFFANLKHVAPDLTPAELKIAALMRLNFTTKETAMITHRSIGTIDNLRSNIRKKLQLEKEENLLQKLSEF